MYPSNRVIVYFWSRCLEQSVLSDVAHQSDEELSFPLSADSSRELHVHHPRGQGASKLVLRASKDGTGRTMNTVAKLSEMAAAAEIGKTTKAGRRP